MKHPVNPVHRAINGWAIGDVACDNLDAIQWMAWSRQIKNSDAIATVKQQPDQMLANKSQAPRHQTLLSHTQSSKQP
jgi:hypothetical protein